MEQSSSHTESPPIIYLPDTGLIRVKDVLTFVRFSESKWHKGVKAGKYPKSVKHDGVTFWNAEDIREVIKKIREENKPRNK